MQGREARRLRFGLSPERPIAVVEAKSELQHPAQGLQQAMDYAHTLGVRFAYATNGHGIVEHDFITGVQSTLDAFPSPDVLWRRLQAEAGLSDADAEDAVAPLHRAVGGKQPRYYQEIAINRAVQAVLNGQKHILITMATGTGKTIVFCVDQEHALEMMGALKAELRDFVQRHPHYIARVVSDEKKIGRGHLDDFQDPEKATPVILTTSQLLTTGVDAPTVKNVVLFKPINSMTEFKQIIGRGARVSEAYGKTWFTIVDYTGATRLFRDPAFDGDPFEGRTVTIDPSEQMTDFSEKSVISSEARETPRKYYVDGAEVWIMGEQAFEMDPNGGVLRRLHYTDYTRDEVRRLLPDANHLRAIWPVSDL